MEVIIVDVWVWKTVPFIKERDLLKYHFLIVEQEKLRMLPLGIVMLWLLIRRETRGRGEIMGIVVRMRIVR